MKHLHDWWIDLDKGGFTVFILGILTALILLYVLVVSFVESVL